VSCNVDTVGPRYYRQPTSYYDLLTSDFTNTGTVRFKNCAAHPAGTKWSTGNAKNVSYAAGVDIGPISLSAQSGYQSSQDIEYNFTQSGWICGTSASGPGHSKQVDSQATKT
jgi:hypothetical protein